MKRIGNVKLGMLAAMTAFGVMTALHLAPASAGLKATVGNVGISDIAGTPIRQANGFMSLIYNSSNTQEYITCEVKSVIGGTREMWCSAKDAQGTVVGCHASDVQGQTFFTTVINAAATINSESYIQFYADKSSGKCTMLRVISGSYIGPKQ